MDTYTVIFSSQNGKYAYLVSADYEEQAIKEGIKLAQAGSKSFISVEAVVILTPILSLVEWNTLSPY